MASQIPDTYICPNCGSEVTVGSPSCPGCGSDDNTGWSEDTLYDGLDLPETPEEYTDFQKKLRKNKITVTLIAALLLLIFIFQFVF